MNEPLPYVIRQSGDLIFANDWNAVQERFRAELRDHDHTGGEAGAKLDGRSFEGEGALHVGSLEVSGRLSTGGLDLMAELDRRLPTSGGTLTGDLVVQGRLTVTGEVRWSPTSTGIYRAPIVRTMPSTKQPGTDSQGRPLRFYKRAEDIPDGVITQVEVPAGQWLVRLRTISGWTSEIGSSFSGTAQIHLLRHEPGAPQRAETVFNASTPAFQGLTTLNAASPCVLVLRSGDRSQWTLMEAHLLLMPLGGQ